MAHEQIVYLDDFEQNLAPAAALGWTTILVGDHDLAIDELRSTLGTLRLRPEVTA